MNTEHWGKQVCFSDQEYHLNRNNLQDEVASGWLNDRKVRSPRQTWGKWDVGVIKRKKKNITGPHAIPRPLEQEPRLCSAVLFLQLKAVTWMRWRIKFWYLISKLNSARIENSLKKRMGLRYFIIFNNNVSASSCLIYFGITLHARVS